MGAAGVVSPRELAVAMMRLGADSMRAQMLADASLARRHGFSVVSRERLTCFLVNDRLRRLKLLECRFQDWRPFAHVNERSAGESRRIRDGVRLPKVILAMPVTQGQP